MTHRRKSMEKEKMKASERNSIDISEEDAHCIT